MLKTIGFSLVLDVILVNLKNIKVASGLLVLMPGPDFSNLYLAITLSLRNVKLMFNIH